MSMHFMKAGCLLLLIFGAACTYLPVTDGYHVRLPERGLSIVTWGNDRTAVSAAVTWLQKQGLIVVDRSRLRLDARFDEAGLTYRVDYEAAVLSTAQEAGVALVVFVDCTGDLRAPMVAVRGVDVATGEILWNGSARYARFVKSPPNDILVRLTSKALTAAWSGSRQVKQKRPPGP